MNHVLYAATKLLDRFSVIPLTAGGKTPVKGLNLKTYQRIRRATPAEITSWFQGDPLPNIGIATGKGLRRGQPTGNAPHPQSRQRLKKRKVRIGIWK